MIRNGGSLPPLRAAVTPGRAGWSASAGSSATRATTRRSRPCRTCSGTTRSARVEILGSGPYEAELRALAEALGWPTG